MANAFGKGDLVQLKSGGPAMTVDYAPGEPIAEFSSTKHELYGCVWFRGASKERGNFAEHLLTVYVAPGNQGVGNGK